MRNGEILQIFKRERNILQTIKKKEANWTGHILCRNCLLRRDTEGEIEGRVEVTGRR